MELVTSAPAPRLGWPSGRRTLAGQAGVGGEERGPGGLSTGRALEGPSAGPRPARAAHGRGG